MIAAMKVLITGATGVIGTAVTEALLARGDTVLALSRDERRGRDALGEAVDVHAWPDPTQAPPPEAALAGTDAVIHLLGESVAQRWNQDTKRKIHDSRVLSTRFLVGALGALGAGERPRVLVSQSATGYYGPRDDAELDESAPAGSDFLAGVVVAWEREALAAPADCRVAVTRTGVVLSPNGGALAQMLPFFKLGIGGPVAGGRQYVPWIHLDDVVGALLHCVDEDRARGAVNATAPNPVTNAELSKTLGRVLHRPAVLPVPSLALTAMYGEMAQIVTTGQRAIPRALEQQGYAFRHPELEPALRDVLGGS
jgi:uncharacterized protein (TIGR01777 family)